MAKEDILAKLDELVAAEEAAAAEPNRALLSSSSVASRKQHQKAHLERIVTALQRAEQRKLRAGNDAAAALWRKASSRLEKQAPHIIIDIVLRVVALHAAQTSAAAAADAAAAAASAATQQRANNDAPKRLRIVNPRQRCDFAQLKSLLLVSKRLHNVLQRSELWRALTAHAFGEQAAASLRVHRDVSRGTTADWQVTLRKAVQRADVALLEAARKRRRIAELEARSALVGRFPCAQCGGATDTITATRNIKTLVYHHCIACGVFYLASKDVGL